MNELAKNLEKYVTLLKNKKRVESALTSEESYMAIRYPKPRQKIINQVDSVPKSTKKFVIVYGILILSIIFIVLGLILGTVLGGLLSFVGMIIGIFVFFFKFPISLLKQFFAEKKEIAAQQEKNAKNQLWNETEYPKLKKQYEDSYSSRKKEYEKIQAEAKEELEKINSELVDYEGLIPTGYIGNVEEIFKIVNEGRAETVTDAINVFENDCYQEKILQEQRAAADYARATYNEAERTRKLQEEEIERQQAAEKEAKRAARHVCTNCVYASNCRKFGTPNCPSYVPRQR